MTAPRHPVPWAAFLGVNASAVIFGTTALFGRIDASPAWISAGRAVFAVAVLGAVALARRIPLALTAAQLRTTMLSGALLGAHWMLFFASAQLGGVAVAAVTVSTFTLFTVLIDALRRRRRPSGVEIAAALAVVAAVALIAGPGANVAAPRPALGAAAGLAAAAVFGLFPLVSQDLGRDLGPVVVSFHQNWAVALFVAPALFFTRPLHPGRLGRHRRPRRRRHRPGPPAPAVRPEPDAGGGGRGAGLAGAGLRHRLRRPDLPRADAPGGVRQRRPDRRRRPGADPAQQGAGRADLRRRRLAQTCGCRWS
jgi:hypothetical protein